MHSSSLLTAASLGLAALVSQAQAVPLSYNFDAIATGDIDGPISGSFTVDMAKVWNSYDLTSPEGQPVFVQFEDPEGGFGMIDWTLPGDQRTTGSIWGATISRAKLANGGSTLTVATSAAFSRGASGEQVFSLTYTSDTDILYTLRHPFLSLNDITSATGSYKHYYALFGEVSIDREFSFTVSSTSAVPEPSAIALLLAGVAMSGLLIIAGRQRRTVRRG